MQLWRPIVLEFFAIFGQNGTIRQAVSELNMRPEYFALLIVFLFSATAQADNRLPVPGEASRTKAESLVKEIYGDEIAAATTPDGQTELVKKLIAEAGRIDSTPHGRYALLNVALENAPDANLAVSVVDEMAKHFQVDSLKLKSSTIWRMSKSAKRISQHDAVAETALPLMDEWVLRDGYDAATTLGDVALQASQDAENRILERQIRRKRIEVADRKANFAEVKKAMTVLEAEPTNPDANLKVGSHKCFALGDWENGLPMIALGNDENLRELAIRELGNATTSDAQAALGDAWWELSEGSVDGTKEKMLSRAGFWYKKSVSSSPALSRLVKLKVEKRLEEIQELFKPEDAEDESEEQESKFVGTWTTFIGNTVVVKADGTAISSRDVVVDRGQWQEKNGTLYIAWGSGDRSSQTLAKNGKTIYCVVIFSDGSRRQGYWTRISD